MNTYKDTCREYYDRVLHKKNVAYLTGILLRKVTKTGGIVASTGAKDKLVDKIFQIDVEVFRSLYTDLCDADLELLERCWDYNPMGGENNQLCSFHTFSITKKDFECGLTKYKLNIKVLSAFMYLFQMRDKQMCDAVNLAKPNRKKYSYYLDIDSVGMFSIRNADVNQPAQLNQSLQIKIQQIQNLFSKTHRIYFPIYKLDTSAVELVFLDLFEEKIVYIDPTQADDVFSKTLNQQRADELSSSLKIFLSTLPNCPEGLLLNYATEVHSYLPSGFQGYEKLNEENKNDAGIYLLIILELLYNDAPLSFMASDMEYFRKYYFNCLLKCEIPQVK
jgi:hypothetical protein